MSDRGVYTVTFGATGITGGGAVIAAASGDYDLFTIVPAAAKHCEIVGLSIGNKTEVAEAQEEMVELAMIRGFTTAGTGGAAATVVALSPSSPAAGFTARTLDSAVATVGTTALLWRDTFNIRAGIFVLLPPEMRPEVRNAEMLVVRMTSALSPDDANMVGTLWVREN